MMIVKNTKNIKETKRSTPSIYKKKKIKVRGYVDRISNDIVVVVINSPKEKDAIEEIYIPVSKFPKGTPNEGDYICVIIER
jgi:hypothetical protein